MVERQPVSLQRDINKAAANNIRGQSQDSSGQEEVKGEVGGTIGSRPANATPGGTPNNNNNSTPNNNNQQQESNNSGDQQQQQQNQQ